jgi:hypothetical protein
MLSNITMKYWEYDMPTNIAPSIIRELLEPVLPPIVFRNHPDFKKLTGYSSRTISNKDSLGIGPDQRLIIGRVTGYPKDSLIRWLESRVRHSRKPNRQNL